MSEHVDETLDCTGLACPMPILKTKKAIDALDSGKVLQMIATDPGSVSDVKAWSNKTGHALLEHREEDGKFIFLIRKS